jgi:hypothetical protein
MDLGGGSGLSTADQSMAASGTTGSISGGFSGPSGGGAGDNNDPYQGFVQASQPRGLSAIQRAVQNTVQKTKDFLSQPANKRGIIGSLIGGALFGPFGAFVGGSIGQRYGGNVSNFFNPTVNTDDTEIDMLTRAGLLPNQLTMPINKAGITGIDIPNFDPNMNLYATRPTSGYEDPDRAKEKDDALEKFYQENPEFRPPEESGINKLQFIV